MRYIYNDGGRSKYFKGTAGDCATRAICNATGLDYKKVYDDINRLAKKERTGTRKRGVSSARDGVYMSTMKKYLEDELGWVWHATMQIGQGCKVHLAADELPAGTIIVRVSHHYTCVKDGVLYDSYDCTRGGDRCVYGYWSKPVDQKRKQELETKIQALKVELKQLEKELKAC